MQERGVQVVDTHAILDGLDRPTDAPKDLRAFWDKTIAELATVAPQYKVEPSPEWSTESHDKCTFDTTHFQHERFPRSRTRPANYWLGSPMKE